MVVTWQIGAFLHSGYQRHEMFCHDPEAMGSHNLFVQVGHMERMNR